MIEPKFVRCLNLLGNLVMFSDCIFITSSNYFSKFLNTVFEFITLFSKPAAMVKVLNTDP